MVEFINGIFAYITAFVSYLTSLVKALLVAFLDLLKDIVCWVFEQSFSLVLSSLSSFDVSSIQSSFSSFGSLPANVLEVLSAIGMGTALSIILSAITIRFLLQLIPFTRLGS